MYIDTWLFFPFFDILYTLKNRETQTMASAATTPTGSENRRRRRSRRRHDEHLEQQQQQTDNDNDNDTPRQRAPTLQTENVSPPENHFPYVIHRRLLSQDYHYSGHEPFDIRTLVPLPSYQVWRHRHTLCQNLQTFRNVWRSIAYDTYTSDELDSLFYTVQQREQPMGYWTWSIQSMKYLPPRPIVNRSRRRASSSPNTAEETDLDAQDDHQGLELDGIDSHAWDQYSRRDLIMRVQRFWWLLKQIPYDVHRTFVRDVPAEVHNTIVGEDNDVTMQQVIDELDNSTLGFSFSENHVQQKKWTITDAETTVDQDHVSVEAQLEREMTPYQQYTDSVQQQHSHGSSSSINQLRSTGTRPTITTTTTASRTRVNRNRNTRTASSTTRVNTSRRRTPAVTTTTTTTTSNEEGKHNEDSSTTDEDETRPPTSSSNRQRTTQQRRQHRQTTVTDEPDQDTDEILQLFPTPETNAVGRARGEQSDRPQTRTRSGRTPRSRTIYSPT